MNKTALHADFLLLLTSAIWGFAFVAQRVGMEYIGPFTYNGIRFALGSLSLLPLIIIRNRMGKQSVTAKHQIDVPQKAASVGQDASAQAYHQHTPDKRYPNNKKSKWSSTMLACSLLAGAVLFVGASLQQAGMQFATAGKGGFLTGLYVVLVPIIGIFLGHKTKLPTWIGALLACGGLYFLSAPETNGSINPGDILVTISAFFWSFHVLIIDRLSKTIDVIKLAASQFAWCALFSLITAAIFEPVAPLPILRALLPILYGGLCSVGIAYTLQVVAQKNAPPAHASILLSLEGAFAALGGILILSEPVTAKNTIGSLLMLSAMVATQWDIIFRKPAQAEALHQ